MSSTSPERILLTYSEKEIFYLSPFSENFIPKSRFKQNSSRSSRLSSYLNIYVILIWKTPNCVPVALFMLRLSHIFVFWFLVTLVALFSFRFFCLAHLVLQNVNKDYVIFSYFCNFVAKSDQKWKMGWTKQCCHAWFVIFKIYQFKKGYYYLHT